MDGEPAQRPPRTLGGLAEPAPLGLPSPPGQLLSRRSLTRAALAGGGAIAVGAAGFEQPATAAPASLTPVAAMRRRYRPRPYKRTKLPTARTLLVAQRFTGGWTPALRSEIARAGGVDRWFARQLTPGKLSDRFYSNSLDWWVSNKASTETIVQRHQTKVEELWEANANYQRWSMLRRMYSERHVLETMANFWEHHFHVPANGEACGVHRAAYGRTIRRLALGRFDTLLNAVATHPSMGCYLGNAVSTKSAPNENQGRELLELHTVGRASGYSEEDVKNSARILTGWRVDVWGTWRDFYDPGAHWTGPVSVLGFQHANASADGRAVTTAYLNYLARHPATARNIARKLAIRFVSDTPSRALVERLAQVYLAHNTAIAPVLKALVNSREFARSAGAKTRTPEEDVIATYRALRVRITRPHSPQAAANAALWQAMQIGQAPFSWPRPDGRPDSGEAWSSVSRVLGSFSVHYNMCGGWWPGNGVKFRRHASWLPAKRIRFDQLVDHLSRSLTGTRSSSRLLRAACQATGIRPAARITRSHPLVRWNMARLLVVFLDHPRHMAR